MAAVHEVIAVPELLENIVLCLPLRQMLLVQQVSTSFRDSVWTSPKINRALFFRASAEDLEYHNTQIHGSASDPWEGEWKCTPNGRRVTPILNPFMDT